MRLAKDRSGRVSGAQPGVHGCRRLSAARHPRTLKTHFPMLETYVRQEGVSEVKNKGIPRFVIQTLNCMLLPDGYTRTSLFKFTCFLSDSTSTQP